MIAFVVLLSLLISYVFGDITCLRQKSHEIGTTYEISNIPDAQMYWPFTCLGPCPCVCPDELPELIFSSTRKEDGNKLTIVFTNEGSVPTTPTVMMISWQGGFAEPSYANGKSFAVPHSYYGDIPENVSVIAQALCYKDFHMVV